MMVRRKVVEGKERIYKKKTGRVENYRFISTITQPYYIFKMCYISTAALLSVAYSIAGLVTASPLSTRTKQWTFSEVSPKEVMVL